MAYKIIDISTGEVIREMQEVPDAIPKNAVLVQVEEGDIRSKYIDELNKMASGEIAKGYTSDEYGVHFGLSETDQLNYTATATIVSMGAESIVIVGEKDGDKYFQLVLNNSDAKTLLSSIFNHVSYILDSYRSYKKRILSAQDEDISSEFSAIIAEIEQPEGQENAS